MKGRILGFNEADGTGAITADDGSRHRFTRTDWRGDKSPVAGLQVDFETMDGAARDIYPLRGSAVSGLQNIDLSAIAASPGAGRIGSLLTQSLATPLALVVLAACFMSALSIPMLSVSLFGLGDLPGLGAAAVAPGARGSSLATIQPLLVLRFAAPIAALWVIWAAWAAKDLRVPMLVAGGSGILAVVLVFALKQAAISMAGPYAGAAVSAMISIGIGTWLLLLASAGLIAAGLGIVRNPLAKTEAPSA